MRFNRCTRDHSFYNNNYDDHDDANSEDGVGEIADQDDDHFCSSPYLRYQVGVPMTGNGFKYNLNTGKSIVQSRILFSSAFLLLTLHVFVGFYCSRSRSCLEV